MAPILLNPGGQVEEPRNELAPRRFTSLDGARLGLLSNTKLNADAILAAIGDLLRERFALEAIVSRRKPTFSHPAPATLVDELVERCDAVIAGVGD